MVGRLLLGMTLALGPAEEAAAPDAAAPEAAAPDAAAPEAGPPDAASPTDAPPPDTPPPDAEASGAEPPAPDDAGPPVAAEPGEGSDTPPPEDPAVEDPALDEAVPVPEEEQAADAMSKLPPPAAQDLQPQAEENEAPPKRPTQFPRLWLGFGIAPGQRAIGFGVGVTYFVIPHIGIGLDLDDTIVFDPSGTYNVFDLTPTITILALPRFRVSPIVKGGFGGEFISHGLGNYGRWLATGGVAFRIGRRLFGTVLAGVDGRVPDSRYSSNFTCGLSNNPCSLGIVIDLGIGFGF